MDPKNKNRENQEENKGRGLKPIKPVVPTIMPNIFDVKTSPMTGDKILVGRITDPPTFTKKEKKSN